MGVGTFSYNSFVDITLTAYSDVSAMMGFLHIYMKYTQPLFVQALMGLKNLYEAKPVAIHVFGRKAEGDLKRPFANAPSMFGGSFFVSFLLICAELYVKQVENLRQIKQQSMRLRKKSAVLKKSRLGTRTINCIGRIEGLLLYCAYGV